MPINAKTNFHTVETLINEMYISKDKGIYNRLIYCTARARSHAHTHEKKHLKCQTAYVPGFKVKLSDRPLRSVLITIVYYGLKLYEQIKM